jgi:hypothetical protein
MQAPPMNRRLRETLDMLHGMGVIPSFDDVVWLAELRRKCDTPPGREPVQFSGSPVEICGTKFWPWHRAAKHWFVYWFHHFEGDSRTQADIYMVAHAYSRPGDATLLDVSDIDSVRRLLGEWDKRQTFSEREESEIMSALYDLDLDGQEIITDPHKPESQDQPHRALEDDVGQLCSMFKGTTPEYWKTGVSVKESNRMAAAVSGAEYAEPTGWANSPIRQRHVANYLNAVKWIVTRSKKAGTADG